MLIEIRLLVRLFRIPLLRAEGFVVLRDDGDSIRPAVNSLRTGLRSDAVTLSAAPGKNRDLRPLGRDLAEAEAIISGINSSSRT